MLLRKLMIRVLQKVNPGDITIRHHHTGDRLRLHSFRHKGYWYHGRRRELETMELFRDLVPPGSFVVEAGAHIGYVSLYLAHLMGPGGQLIVFEPGANNLEYLRCNLAGMPQIRLEEKAVCDFNGVTKFYTENLSGQNNSLLSDYEIPEVNQRSAGISKVERGVMDVECVRIDDFLAEGNYPVPSFIKIDIEGAELMALRGLSNTLKQPGVALMVEVRRNRDEVHRLLADAGYRLFDEYRREIASFENARENVFCIQHADPRLQFMIRAAAA